MTNSELLVEVCKLYGVYRGAEPGVSPAHMGRLGAYSFIWVEEPFDVFVRDHSGFDVEFRRAGKLTAPGLTSKIDDAMTLASLDCGSVAVNFEWSFDWDSFPIGGQPKAPGAAVTVTFDRLLFGAVRVETDWASVDPVLIALCAAHARQEEVPLADWLLDNVPGLRAEAERLRGGPS